MARKSLPFQTKTAAIILKRIAKGETLEEICKDSHIPSRSTIYKWLKENKEFKSKFEASQTGNMSLKTQVARARETKPSKPKPVLKAKPKTYAKKTTPIKKRKTAVRYSRSLEDEIIDLVVDGHSIVTICNRPDMPTRRVLYRWFESRNDFRRRYEMAAQFAAGIAVSEIIEIADDSVDDWLETEKGMVFNKEAVQRSRLKVDARLKNAEKQLPKKWGNKITQEVTSPEDKPVLIKSDRKITDLELARRIAYLISKGMPDTGKQPDTK